MIQIIIYVLLAIVCIFILINAVMPSKYDIAVSHDIATSKEAIFPYIVDLRKWLTWIPWAINDKDTKWVFSEVTDVIGSSYSWDSKIIGGGSMKIIGLESPHSVTHELLFAHPKSTPCETSMSLSDAKNGKTSVTWTMKGSMSFSSRFFIPILKKMLKKDYTLGLKILEQQVLYPTDEHKMIIDEDITESPFDFAYLEARLNVTNTQAIKNHFDASVDIRKTLEEQFGKNAVGQGVGVYSHYNIFTKTMKIRAGYKISADRSSGSSIGSSTGGSHSNSNSSGKFGTATTKGGAYHKLVLRGNYSLIPEAWNVLMAHPKAVGMRSDYSRESYEVYIKTDETVDGVGQEPVTEIYLPVKGTAKKRKH